MSDKNSTNHAIVYPASPTYFSSQTLTADNAQIASYRHHLWARLSESINKHTDPSALFISWWPNSQRIHFMTARKVWFKNPHKNGYNNPKERSMWGEIAGGFNDDERAQIFAQALVLPVQDGIKKLTKALSGYQNVFILISSDDLSHFSEIITLANLEKIPLEVKVFNQLSNDIHTTIARVKRWAGAGNGTGNYMVQTIGKSTRLRVWKVTDKAFEDSLLVQLLPFSTSLQNQNDHIKLVYQSAQGALNIYQLDPALLAKTKPTK